eukprot:TRINITY_DN12385_c0_g1_i1.p1 TRINITY_DN12385_c0_g1~~TRINITY_DN12385_c0_g1_i1.p1  ORF type:complete len:667 (-),score=150.46 TRINITY_DN12385_c0_g1_i1:106-2106(-)
MNPDKIAAMMAKQKEREEAMRKKEAEKNAAAQAKKNDENAAYLAKVAPAVKKQEAPSQPTDNWFLLKKNLYAPLPPTTRGRPTLIGGDPSGENIVYCLGNSVFIRNINNPLIADIYSEHTHPTTVARYSPDRKYIASGDQIGNVRVWHTQVVGQFAHKLVLEKKVLGGAIYDLAWDIESKRIVAVGQGRDKFGVAFNAETGSGQGDIGYHSKPITCTAIRPVKPYRIITGAEDFQVNTFENFPLKYKSTISKFSNFINCVQFSPDGSQFLIVAQDKQGLFGDAETMQITHSLEVENGHKGGVYACSYSPDGKQVLTVSGDKTARIWESATGKLVETHTFGTELEDQLVGCLWQGNHKIVLSLGAQLIYLPAQPGSPPSRVITGHNKGIEAIAFDQSNNSIYTGSYDTVITKWNAETGDVQGISGKGHTNAVKRLAVQNGKLVSISQDDNLRATPLDTLKYSPDFVALGSPPTDLAVGKKQSDLVVVVTVQALLVLRNFKIVTRKDIAGSPQAVALSPSEDVIAVGTENQKVILFRLNGNDVTEEDTLTAHRAPLSRLDFSPDGKYLASADRNRIIYIWDAATKKELITDWVYHTARVDALQFHADSRHLVSGGLDQTIIVWDVANPSERVTIKGAHQGGITGAVWIDEKTVATIGQDSTLRTWVVL